MSNVIIVGGRQDPELCFKYSAFDKEFWFYVQPDQKHNAEMLMQNITAMRDIWDLEYRIATESGFHDEYRGSDRALMLIIGEVAEAHEETRLDKEIVYFDPRDGKPLGYLSELVDVLVRAKDTLIDHQYGYSSFDMYIVKMFFNMTRQKKHGKKF